MSIALSVAAVQQFHNFLMSDVNHLVAGNLTIAATGPLSDEIWTKKKARGDVLFEMIADGISAITRASERFNSFAIPLNYDDTVADKCRFGWISWREQWEKMEGVLKLSLSTISVTFFWGPPHSLTPLFRADWDQKGKGSTEAGHPHWQFPDFHSPDIHFGMAGWHFSDSSPQCWQHYPDDETAIRRWAVRTVGYARSQLIRHPP
jgi:hypothetical protein